MLVADDPNTQDERTKQDKKRLVARGNFVEEEQEYKWDEIIEKDWKRKRPFPQEHNGNGNRQE